MPTAIPPRFVSVDTAKSSQGHHNVIGVVVDCLPKYQTGGTSFVVTFTIKDADYGKGNQSWTGMKIKYFNNDEHRLPDLRVNDVILLRRIRVRPHQGALLGVASQADNVPWAVFRQPEGLASSELPSCSPGSKAISLEEQTYVDWLLDRIARSRSNTSSTPMKRPTESSMTPRNGKQQAAQIAQPAPVAKKRDRFSLIKNLTMDTFVDLTVHVVKTWYQDDRVHLYVTDYTVNKSLFDYQEKSDDEEDGGTFGDEFGFMTRNTRERRTWQGPMGRMTVQITLWDPHSTYAREHVREDSYVALSNVRVKTDKMNGIMEGVIHTDKMYPHKLGIRLLEDDDEDSRFDELKKRKREYWRQNKMNKRKVTEDFGETEGPKKNAKKRRKEQLRLKKQQEQKQKQQQQQRKEEGQTEIPVTMLPAKGPNPHIQAKAPAIACRKLSEILTNESHNISLPGNIQYRLPFQNVKYRTIVRVVDFFPPNIADFAVPYKARRYSASPPSSSEDEDDITPETRGIKWEWRFCLLVEDDKVAPGQARDRIKLFVSGAEAEFLLKLDAKNLRRNRTTLNRLKEKLCILWGDLEEYKNGGMSDGPQKGPSQRPFTCCIKEFGVPCACQRKAALGDGDDSDDGVILGPEHNQQCLGWERRFALFGTTINEE